MLWFLYNVLFVIGYVLMLPKFLLRMWRRGGYRRGFLQRFGWYPVELIARLQSRPRIWIHAVSVGEIYVALRFIQEFRNREPGIAFVLTTTTSTGHALAAKRLHADDELLYFPCDFPPVLKRVFAAVRPRAILLVECELWPNMLRLADRRGIPVALVNGRISDASYRGYRKLRLFAARILRRLPLLLVQTPTDAERLIALGAATDRVRVMGTAKYDVTDGAPRGGEQAARVLEACGAPADRLVLVAGSTWSGEEALLLDAYQQLRPAFPHLRLVLVPRHAERRAEVEAEAAKRNLRWLRRSELADAPPPSLSLIHI